MIDWWNLQPPWCKRLRLFLGIVWRMHEGNRMTCALSWDVAKCLYPIKNRGQHALLVELKAKGWKHVAEGGKDFCPKCKPRRKPRRRSRTTVVPVNSERKTERG